ncbi:NAD(P)-dependent oxidoreductase [Myxococcus sp. K15C18031901]|uniref:NAD(P)-dependent oxidoreductase n=1 Tax=Myxococcus dinghuensis TaxID=2906761 RepID=UPI0020A75442|nr:NAD(P)-dependent oxidoreductase [Myxococcus dinghuensis]MCP3102594.1 NAD(P)-dependent oxidoreductase [Myxococcus dinghuensis]
MSTNTLKPVLVIGGSGVVGRRAVKALRRLQPELPLWIGGRDTNKAATLAREVGLAEAVRVDLERDDLGLPPDADVSGVVVLLKDDTLRSLKYAQAKGVPSVSFSDFAFDIGPAVALHAHRPARAPILLLGHFLGGVMTLVTLHLAREFKVVHSIEVGGLFDEEDVGGPAASGDMERLTKGVPSPLIRHEGRFLWASGDEATRVFHGVDGTAWTGRAYPLLDVPSLAAATDARTVRLDFAVRPVAARPPGQGAGLEVVIDLTGETAEGVTKRVRHALVDPDVHSGLSALGAALATERLLGLAGGAPVGPGLHHPEGVLDPAYVVERVRESGTRLWKM